MMISELKGDFGQKIFIVLLDVNTSRNPSGRPDVIEITKTDALSYYRKFLELREQYKDEYGV